MARKFSRFLNIERAREARQAETIAAPNRSHRFDSVEPTATTPSSQRSSSAHLGRFDPEAEPSSLHLHEKSDADQPFVRCARCGADGGRFASSCMSCGASFDTAEQRAYNESVWAQRRADREKEREHHRELENARAADLEQAEVEKRAYYENLARHVRDETRGRMGSGWGGGWAAGGWGYGLWGLGRRFRLPLGLHVVIVGGIALVYVGAAVFTGGLRAGGRAMILALVFVAIASVRRLFWR